MSKILRLRLVVTGSRCCADRIKVYDALDAFRRRCWYLTVLHGGAREGVDHFTDVWCDLRGVTREIYRPDYNKWSGKVAPLKRNDEMIAAAPQPGWECGVLAVWDGESGGTGYTINAARAAGLKLKIVTFNNGD